jgi:hypothetical protein
MISAIDEIFNRDAALVDRAFKADVLLRELSNLTEFHWHNCEPYRNILESYRLTPPFDFRDLTDMPALPVSLFKEHELRSIPEDRVARVLRSSGTTGQVPSKIYLDSETARLQTRALVKIFQSIIGAQRLPMLIVDQQRTITDRRSFSARGAGILGLSNFGREHTYALDDDMRLDMPALERFIERFGGQRVLLFGFTFMVWKYLVEPLASIGRRLPFDEGILIHCGGWKKLQDQAVSREVFRKGITKSTGITSIRDFYGMVEQVGSVFVECSEGVLHAPPFADVIIREARTWAPLGPGTPGVVQVLSVLPRSYPGHSILTEDLGELVGEDDCACGNPGRTFRIVGRVPRAEARGCSDTFVAATA